MSVNGNNKTCLLGKPQSFPLLFKTQQQALNVSELTPVPSSTSLVPGPATLLPTCVQGQDRAVATPAPGLRPLHTHLRPLLFDSHERWALRFANFPLFFISKISEE